MMKILHMRRVAYRLVPTDLNFVQKQHRKTVAEKMISEANNDLTWSTRGYREKSFAKIPAKISLEQVKEYLDKEQAVFRSGFDKISVSFALYRFRASFRQLKQRMYLLFEHEGGKS